MPKTTFHVNERRSTFKNNPSDYIPPLKKHIGLGQIKKVKLAEYAVIHRFLLDGLGGCSCICSQV